MFLGYSNLVKGRILPILAKAGFSEVTIAKYKGQLWDDEFRKCALPVTCYDSYEEGLAHFKGDLVYVSTVNSTHVEFAKKSLEAGFNTIVDKPATTTLQEAQELVELAKSKHLLLGESTVYLVHPQLEAIRKVFSNNEDAPKMLTVHFTMPPFKPENFRYQKSLGGGAIMDTAPYAVSIARYFLGDEPNNVYCIVNEQKDDGLDIEYSLMIQYAGGKSMIGHFGFNTEYINQVFLLGDRTNVMVNRIFTIPDSMENELVVTHMNETSTIKTPSGNNFEIYLAEILNMLESGNYEKAYHPLLVDAKIKQMIFDSIK